MNYFNLKDLSFFSDFCEEDIIYLTPFFTYQTYKTGEVIFEQDDLAEFLFLVLYGKVSIRYKPDDGPLMKVAEINSGGVFGWSAAMGNVSYTSGAECTEDCNTIKLRGSDLVKIRKKNPKLGRLILDRLSFVISERWQNRQTQVISLLSRGLDFSDKSRNKTKEKETMDEKKNMIKEEQMKVLVEQLSAYIEHFHGGSVEYISFDGKKLIVKLGGACLGCPLSPATLHGWVEGTVRQFFPEIEKVEAM